MAEAPSREDIERALREHPTIAAAARSLGVERRRLSEVVNRDESLRALRPGGRCTDVKASGDDVKVTVGDGQEVADAMRGAGLDPADFYATGVRVWETYHGDKRVTATYRRRVSLALLAQASHVPALVRPVPVERPHGAPELIVVEGDHQAPYHDPGLDACTTEFVREMQPVEHVFLGDTADFPTISRHADHPAATAGVQECVDAAYGILRRRAEAAPNAKRLKLKGNHDWRLEGELLARAERLHGVRPAGEDDSALSLRRLLHLDALGVELVEDRRGWEHAEVVLVPGGNGLVVRHGLFTGKDVATRTMHKLGRSVIVGHGHQKEHAWRVVYPKQLLQQAVVAGTMSRNDHVFPHFATNPNWHQGFVTVERWPDGTFVIEHAVYHRGSLYWRDRRWDAPEGLA